LYGVSNDAGGAEAAGAEAIAGGGDTSSTEFVTSTAGKSSSFRHLAPVRFLRGTHSSSSLSEAVESSNEGTAATSD
jgi:hypothetical protein